MLLPINFPGLAGYTIAPLTRGDRPSIQQLCERCAEYVELTTGHKPDSSEADRLYRTLPAGKSLDDKMLLGIFSVHPERLIGILEAIYNHPQADDWYLGLLLLDPAQRGHGLGTRIYRNLEQWLAEIGASTIWLSVLEANQPAYHFWQHLGFEEVERQKSERIDDKESRKIVMKRSLAEVIKQA